MMTTQKRKIISLNLALLFILLAALPAGAAETVETDPQSAEREALLAQRLEQITAPAGEEQAELSAKESYLIQVGKTVFYSDQDKSGVGWTYTADNRRLTLDNYQDSGIAASGDLVIYAYGDNQVTGKDGAQYGQDGILVDGQLQINVMTGNSLSVTGGSGRSGAGKGISATDSLLCWINGELGAVGGDTTASNALGGAGLHARGWVSIYGDGAVLAMGGQAVNGMGGCGILSGTVDVSTDCVIVGASGYFGGDGIYFGYDCSLGVIDGVFVGGEASSSSAYNGAPIRGSEGEAVWYYDEHIILSESDRILTVTVKEYTLNISGNGGRRDGQTFFSDTQKYPAYYRLSDYIFQRDKYTQVGWREQGGSGDFVALNGSYIPKADTTLSAEWIMVDPGDVVINSLSGTLAGGSHYRSQRTALTLPSQVNNRYGAASDVLGWSSILDLEPNPTMQIIQGVWYEGGSVVQPDKNSVQLLYAHSTTGKYVRYHPNGGTFQNGGTIMVQGTIVSVTDLEVYAMDDRAMTAPQGCVFRGWSRAADVDAVRYTAGEGIHFPYLPANQLIDLYAVWEQVEFVETIEPGVQVRSNVEDGTVTVELTQAWCQEKGGEMVIAAGLTAGDAPKLLRTAAASCGVGDMRLTFQCSPQTPVRVKLFVLDENLAPVCAHLETMVFSPQGQS